MWALANQWDGLRRFSLWNRLAWTDLQRLYRRSLFGLLWLALSFGMFVAAKIFVFGSIATVDPAEFSIWLTIGFWLWMYISGATIEACNSFVAARSWILGTSLPLSVHVYEMVVKSVIRFAFVLPVIGLILFVLRWTPSLDWLWFVPGFFVFILNTVWAGFLLGTLSARYRDLIHFVTALMRVFFFLTPILYMPQQLGENAKYLVYNPFTHYLAIIRDPIMGYGVPVLSWIVVGAITLGGSLLALLVYQKAGRSVAFHIS